MYLSWYVEEATSFK